MAGIPVYTNRGKGGGISLLPDYVIDKAVLTMDEKNKILESLQTLSAVGFDDEKQVVEKLQSFFGNNTQDWIEVDFSNWGDNQEEAELFSKLKTAVLLRKYVNIEYSASKRETTKRRIRPLKLCFRGQAWYLYAYCELRKDYRFFKLHRISECIAEEEQFAYEAVGKLFAEKAYVTEHGKKEPVRVTVAINREMAFRAYDEFPVAKVREGEKLICEIEVLDMESFLGYVFSYGSYMEVIAPDEVREAAKKEILEMAKKYS